MQISLDKSVVDQLSSRGVLAYVAVKLAEGAEASTAALAGSVRAQTSVMLEGLKELSSVVPGSVTKVKTKWRCGIVSGGDGVTLVQNLDSDRFRAFVDDLKKYWDYLNAPSFPFVMDALDGRVIREFINNHKAWTQEEWRVALNHRKTSVVQFSHAPRSQRLSAWVGHLTDYAAGPLNQYGKPAEGGKRGEIIGVQQANSAAGASFVESVRNGR